MGAEGEEEEGEGEKGHQREAYLPHRSPQEEQQVAAQPPRREGAELATTPTSSFVRLSFPLMEIEFRKQGFETMCTLDCTIDQKESRID